MIKEELPRVFRLLIQLAEKARVEAEEEREKVKKKKADGKGEKGDRL